MPLPAFINPPPPPITPLKVVFVPSPSIVKVTPSAISTIPVPLPLKDWMVSLTSTR